MRRVAMVVGVLLLVSVCALAGEPGNIKDLVAGKVAPFTMKLKELDGSYLRFSSPYLSGGGWLSTMRSYGGSEGAPAYSQGRTVKIGDENFLIAYSVETQGGDPSFMYGRPDPNAPEPEPVTEDSILTLALICQRSAIALTKVRPFNLAAELADYQRYLERYQALVASRGASRTSPVQCQPPTT